MKSITITIILLAKLQLGVASPLILAEGSKVAELQRILNELVNMGVPGVAMAVYSPNGWWEAAAGVTSIEQGEQMRTNHLHFLQSIAKTYMAVAMFQLFDEGRIDLDAPITQYLAEKYSKYLKNADQVTVRMLLNHTSGIPEYNSAPAYVSQLLQQPNYPFMPEHYLRQIKNKNFDFAPGSKYAYRNTNYLLLALIADQITGDHTRYISDSILLPLGLNDTYYRNSPTYLDHPQMVQSYWDRNSTGIIENVSTLQRNNVKCMIGDDGIIATPRDAVIFLKGLLEGKLISDQSLQMMKTWVKGRNGLDEYGQGLDFARFDGAEAIGHSGGGIGAGCQLYFFPSKGLYVFVGINLGTVTGSPIHSEAEPIIDRLYAELLK